MMRSRGLLQLLERSAELLEWCSEGAQGRVSGEMREVAKELRKAHEYHKPNCMGGPANMFDAIADRVRAGDSMAECLADYGLLFERKHSERGR